MVGRAGQACLAAALIVGGATAASGCDSSSSPSAITPPPVPPTSPSPSVPPSSQGAAHALEAALLAKKGQPHPTQARCGREAADARSAVAAFGHKPGVVYGCRLVVFGKASPYDVQVLRNGCYVAQRRDADKAIFGCGARAAAPA